MAHLLGAEQLRVEYPTRVVLDGVTVGIGDGDRIGVVGRNGDGKSTLLRILAGKQEPDAGRVTRRRGVTLGMLDQADALATGQTVLATIVGDRAEHEWAGDARVRDVLAGLVPDIPGDTLVDDLSGGQRRRVALAALLSRDWDIVVLDEPTNHLDIGGVAWLAEHLKRRWPRGQGALVVVTHDRWFLDEVSENTWEVHDQIVEPFEGGYAAYVLQRMERDRQAATVEAKRQNLMKKELAWLRRGAPARTAKPKFRIEAANALIADVPPLRNTVELTQMATTRLGKDVIDLIDVSVAYDGATIIRDVEWLIAPGERTGILGVNGAGKSTLLKLIDGTLQPTSGRVKRGKTVVVATLDQQLADLSSVAHERVSAVIASKRTSYVAGGKELTPGQLLERLGFTSAQLSTPVKDLSGGQKRRLQLLMILLDEPNVLIMDEPTNDLDTDMLAAIEDLLDSWPGTLIVVSHDRYLLERVTDQQYAILPGPDGAGRLRHLPGGVDEYLRLAAQLAAPTGGQDAGRATVASVSGAQSGAGSAGAGSGGGGSAASGAGASAGGPAAASAPALGGAERRAAEKELAAIDRKLAKLQGRVDELHVALAEHDVSDYAGIGALHETLREVEAERDELETRWLELGELLA
ncbi:ATPase subunit of ABC transporter with duplicated ATPase domains [Microcella putealis]|uniref:ATPase subunit of ABC transporter with duplicated ATPase domains n=1 Tax=Microcella putealis TaxID=337005 RepID=A0A4Q7LZ66_9MICO|nr:ABC-F family ATP-binding cassette domain-containing protein [Microcella putealis]RZS59632.1 ATPase subunit of ABC transporter with duplicated ATPase domains [Microcella putealis]TQM26745.1 ATPase subunit of ABC transporter with duplicated ATPase domains [Microcella putealis]